MHPRCTIFFTVIFVLKALSRFQLINPPRKLFILRLATIHFINTGFVSPKLAAIIYFYFFFAFFVNE